MMARNTRRRPPPKEPRRKRTRSTQPQKSNSGRQWWKLVGWLHHHRTALQKSLLQVSRNKFISLISWCGIGVALALPMIFLLALDNLGEMEQVLSEGGGITVYLKADNVPATDDRVVQMIREMPEVGRVRYLSRNESLEEFLRWSGYRDVLEGLGSNPLPAVIMVDLANEAPTAYEVELLRLSLDALPEADYAVADLDWVRRLGELIDLANRMVVAIGLMLLLAALLTVFYNVRLMVAGAQEEIRIIKLIGGTNAYIRRPFLYTGFWYGLGGGVLALLIVGSLVEWVSIPLNRLLGLYDSQYVIQSMSLNVAAALVSISVLMGWLGSLISVSLNISRVEPDFDQ